MYLLLPIFFVILSAVVLVACLAVAVVMLLPVRWRNGYVLNNFIALDQLVNAMTGGDHDETISSVLGKHKKCKFCRAACWLLGLLDKDHCVKSIELDEGGRSVRTWGD